MPKAKPQARVCLIGLDSVPPALLFHKFWPHLPHLRRLAEEGGAGILQSCDPPITVPAWAAMLTGYDPGALGLYGFHDRVDHRYDKRRLASSQSYTRPPLWQRLSQAGLRSYVLGVPHTYPPEAFSGEMVTGMLTPPDVGVATWPADVAGQVVAMLGGAGLDVDDFRHTEPEALVARVRAASRGLFALARHYATRDDWSLLTLVDMGPDRLQHALWHFTFADHPHFVPDHPLQGALLAYYVLLDTLVGELLDVLHDEDMVLVVSDHGACPMLRAVVLNTWLVQHGWLVLKRAAVRDGPLDCADVDWSRTRAWADGGYVGRIYVNQRGREPAGVVAAGEVEAVLRAICDGLCATLPTPPLPHRFVRPRDIYAELNGCAPDMLVYFADLRWRALGGVGPGPVMREENDIGPDGANHDSNGVILMRGLQGSALGPRHTLYDVAPTVLAHLQQPIDAGMRGTPVTGARLAVSRAAGPIAHEEAR